MKRLLVILLLACTASLALAAPAVRDLTAAQARKLLSRTPKAFLLDVRTPDEYRQGHLRGAVLVPLSDLERRVREVPRNRTVLVYCAVGSRSRMAAGLLAGKGYAQVYNMSDGIVGWYRSGLPIER
jgi:rhodanese-related sulfurtransferase